jgi:RNA polymerase sigma-70 factor (ECF subfamily)
LFANGGGNPADLQLILQKTIFSGRNLNPGATKPVKSESALPPTDQMTTERPRVEGNYPEASDVSLVQQAAAGNEKAFRTLVDRHADRMYRMAVSMVGSVADAEDVLQETFAGAYKGLKGFEARSSVKTWLTRILMTQAAKWRRDRKRQADLNLDDNAERAATVSGTSGVVGAKIDVQAAIAKLSPEHRQVMVLREFEQMSYEEMAQVLDVPRGTVESRLHRARAELKELLKAYLP